MWVGLWVQMARRLNLLSPKFVEMIEKPGRYADGGGLYLQVAVAKNGGTTKSWLFRYMRRHRSRSGKPTSREMGLGPLSTNKRDGFVSIKEAQDGHIGRGKPLRPVLTPSMRDRLSGPPRSLRRPNRLPFHNALPNTSKATRPDGRVKST